MLLADYRHLQYREALSTMGWVPPINMPQDGPIRTFRSRSLPAAA